MRPLSPSLVITRFRPPCHGFRGLAPPPPRDAPSGWRLVWRRFRRDATLRRRRDAARDAAGWEAGGGDDDDDAIDGQGDGDGGEGEGEGEGDGDGDGALFDDEDDAARRDEVC